ncbi:D-alanyl-D-alanine carboxypeptidase / D-alanyl-D-alanine-endopeptidase (penicillin-binding protein 4) [Pseudarcicella hirudinis]|uniref:D-alanyl-D-alanine carboxypeptidase / D-alanyl-D-alanine-endopeptidase (Penicillin-binding protein 4) n=1 Tax=Pseudarcicella hirudinis TaxID=1079859 RepID=A0A1I5XDB5_9BACT|nr:D-alanyl-D-alanine carboxypeptidase [Pseudarcicella hirudinis]SFQ29975.1 D-alanyl-D-alanine carboxypeptidase / D-alanyl-D-alanine-endopeptidase (penicillin-binding protein 4) [Pseudarcicella hirudinis]
MNFRKFLKLLLVFAIVGLQFSCSTQRKLVKALQSDKVFSQNHTGVMLYDIAEKKNVLEYNAERYFMPASNAKLVTFYIALKTLPDSIPALRYVVKNDSLIFCGTGDPAGLHPDLKNTKVYDFLKSRQEKLFYTEDSFTGSSFGEGWAWDDYNDYYSTEISPLPLYSNIVRFSGKPDKNLLIEPGFFKDKTYSWSHGKDFEVKRDVGSNLFSFPNTPAKAGFVQDVPFKTSSDLTTALLKDTLRKEVSLINYTLDNQAKTVYSLRADSLYKRMLHLSDNFIAEHLILLAANAQGKALNSSEMITVLKKTLLSDLPDAPRWVDGSGLSRYNLFTPRDFVKILEKIHEIVPEERLYDLLPAAGVSGTLKNVGENGGKPFIFAKSGSFSNNYNLSGFLITRSGKTFAFSMMNNNFMKSISEVRKEVIRFLTEVHEKY